jgi:pyruvate/2-oxoglutarate/acetoin dehydrogenase E1 component
VREITFTQAIKEAVDEEMARDPSVFLMGQDVGEYWGGPLHEYAGLFEKYGAKRIKDTPISETAMLGAAVGAAAAGMRPIVAIMFTDFLGVCCDELMNQATKLRYMFGGKAKVPVTIVSYSGAGAATAGQHSKCAEGFLMTIPGLKIVSPSNAYDAKGLLKSSIREDNPVVFSINKPIIFSGAKSEIPEGDYTVPIGKADVKRKGTDVTVVGIQLMVHRALAAAATLEKAGISAEVIDLRSAVPLDKKAVLGSVRKTGRLVVVDEEPVTGSLASEVSAVVAEEAFDALKAPIKRVCAPDTPVPYSSPLEQFWMPSVERIVDAVKGVL